MCESQTSQILQGHTRKKAISINHSALRNFETAQERHFYVFRLHACAMDDIS